MFDFLLEQLRKSNDDSNSTGDTAAATPLESPENTFAKTNALFLRYCARHLHNTNRREIQRESEYTVAGIAYKVSKHSGRLLPIILHHGSVKMIKAVLDYEGTELCIFDLMSVIRDEFNFSSLEECYYLTSGPNYAATNRSTEVIAEYVRTEVWKGFRTFEDPRCKDNAVIQSLINKVVKSSTRQSEIVKLLLPDESFNGETIAGESNDSAISNEGSELFNFKAKNMLGCETGKRRRYLLSQLAEMPECYVPDDLRRRLTKYCSYE